MADGVNDRIYAAWLQCKHEGRRKYVTRQGLRIGGLMAIGLLLNSARKERIAQEALFDVVAAAFVGFLLALGAWHRCEKRFKTENDVAVGNPNSNDAPWIKRSLVILFIVLAFLIAREGLRVNFPDHGAEFEAAKQKLATAKNDEARYYLLDDAAFHGVMAGRGQESGELAIELLQQAERFKGWNYGNAIHKAHTVLGLVALQSNDLASAKAHLLQSAPSDGSPQMRSFGPDMSLAKELLKRGERQVVMQFFDLCDTFWKVPDGWREQVERGDMPRF